MPPLPVPPPLPFKHLLTPTPADESRFFPGDYTLNLYHGCNHGCIYCDSRSVCYRLTDFDRVRPKADCLPALERELRGKKRPGVVAMGSASDAYNALEAKLQLTRGALLLLRRYGFGVGLSTKSALIARDAALLGEIAAQAAVWTAFSITTGDDALAARLEPHASPPPQRFQAMEALAKAGVLTGVWLNPMLPFLTDTPANIRDILRRTADAGGRLAVCHFAVTLREGDREYFYQALDADPAFAGIKARYVQAFGLDYLCPTPQREALAALFDEECDRLGLMWRFSEIAMAARRGCARQLTLWECEP